MQGFQNYLRWSVAFTPVGDMSVVDVYNRVVHLMWVYIDAVAK
mgnify:CR=1 FL=1